MHTAYPDASPVTRDVAEAPACSTEPSGPETHPDFHVLVLEPNRSIARFYLQVFGAQDCIVAVATSLQEGSTLLNRRRFDLVVASLPLADERLLDLVATVYLHRPPAPILLISPEYDSNDISVLSSFGISAGVVRSETLFDYALAVAASLPNAVGERCPSGRQVWQALQDENPAPLRPFALEPGDLVDLGGRLVALPKLTPEMQKQDEESVRQAALDLIVRGSIDTFIRVARAIGKPRLALAIVGLAESGALGDHTDQLLSLLTMIPSYPSKSAAERLITSFSGSKLQLCCTRLRKELIRKHPIILHTERLLSGHSEERTLVDAALSIARCQEDLAVAVLSRALAGRRRTVVYAALKALGQVQTEAAESVLVKRLRMLRLIRETAFFPGDHDATQHYLCLDALCTIVGRRRQPSPEIAAEAAADLLIPDIAVQRKATELVALCRDASQVRALARLLDSDDWRLRLAAVQAIGEVGAPQADQLLAPALSDPNSLVRKKANDVFRQLAVRQHQQLGPGSEYPGQGPGQAARPWQQQGQISADQLVRIVEDGDEAQVREALRQVCQAPAPGTESVIARLVKRADNPKLVAEAAECLGRLGTLKAAQALLASLDGLSSSPDFRLALLLAGLATALGSIKTELPATFRRRILDIAEVLAYVADDPARLQIASILGKIEGLSNSECDRALKLLQTLTLQPSAHPAAQKDLLEVAARAASHLNAIKQDTIQLEAVEARLSQAIASLSKEPAGKRRTLITTLGELFCALPPPRAAKAARAYSEAVEFLLESLNDPSLPWSERAVAIRCLGHIGERRALRALNSIQRTAASHLANAAGEAVRAIVRRNLADLVGRGRAGAV